MNPIGPEVEEKFCFEWTDIRTTIGVFFIISSLPVIDFYKASLKIVCCQIQHMRDIRQQTNKYTNKHPTTLE